MSTSELKKNQKKNKMNNKSVFAHRSNFEIAKQLLAYLLIFELRLSNGESTPISIKVSSQVVRSDITAARTLSIVPVSLVSIDSNPDCRSKIAISNVSNAEVGFTSDSSMWDEIDFVHNCGSLVTSQISSRSVGTVESEEEDAEVGGVDDGDWGDDASDASDASDFSDEEYESKGNSMSEGDNASESDSWEFSAESSESVGDWAGGDGDIDIDGCGDEDWDGDACGATNESTREPNGAELRGTQTVLAGKKREERARRRKTLRPLMSSIFCSCCSLPPENKKIITGWKGREMDGVLLKVIDGGGGALKKASTAIGAQSSNCLK